MKLSIVVLGLSLILLSLGGYCDITGKRVFGMSREHYWSDATYMVGLAIALHLLLRV